MATSNVCVVLCSADCVLLLLWLRWRSEHILWPIHANHHVIPRGSHTFPCNCITNLEIPKQWRAFTLARCQALPSAIQEGRFRKIPYKERKCPCGSGQLEATEHVFLHCQYYTDIRARFILPILHKFPGRSEQLYTSLLLLDANPDVTYSVARYCAAMMDIRRRMVCVSNQAWTKGPHCKTGVPSSYTFYSSLCSYLFLTISFYPLSV